MVPATSWPRITGIPTPRRNVPLRTTTSWKQTPQAATAILISRGPGSRAATLATRRTSGGPVLSTTMARIRISRRSVRPEPAGDDLPLAALGLDDRTRQCAGMLGCLEGQWRHQAGVKTFHALERAHDRRLVGLAA